MTEEKKLNEVKEKDHGRIFFSWTFSEFPQYQRGKNWYIGAAAITALLLIFSLITTNFLFAIIVVISVLIIILFKRSSNKIEFKITEDGILLNKNFYDYGEIKNFYIIYQPPEVKTLYFEPKSILKPRFPISLEDQNPVKIREVLLKYLPEDLDKENEPLSDQFSRLLKL